MIDWQAFKTQLQSDPGKILGFVLSIAVCFLVIWVLVVMQSDSSVNDTVAVDRSGRLDSLRLTLDKPAADSAALGESKILPEQKIETGESESSSLFSILPTFFIMVGAIAVLWLWIKKRNSGSHSTETGALFVRIASQDVSPGHQLTVIKMNREYWVLGTGSQGMNLLHRYNEDEWHGPKGVPEAEGTGTNLFAGILSRKQEQQGFGENGKG